MPDPTVVIGAAADKEPRSPFAGTFTCSDARNLPSGCGHCRMRTAVGRRTATSVTGLIAGAAIATIMLLPALYLMAFAYPVGILLTAAA